MSDEPLTSVESTRLDAILALIEDDPEREITMTARTLCAVLERFKPPTPAEHPLAGLLKECRPIVAQAIEWGTERGVFGLGVMKLTLEQLDAALAATEVE